MTEQPLLRAEISQYLSILVFLQYLATWVRWDLGCPVSICAQRTKCATVADASALHKVVPLAVNRPELAVTIKRGFIDMQDCELACWADSAFANAEGEKSQHGVCFGLAPKGETSSMSSTGDLSRIIPLMGFQAQ